MKRYRYPQIYSRQILDDFGSLVERKIEQKRKPWVASVSNLEVYTTCYAVLDQQPKMSGHSL